MSGTRAAGGKITGSYAETFEGVFSTPAVLTGTVELDSRRSGGAACCPRRPTRCPSRRAPAPAFLACDICPDGACPADHTQAGAQFLKAAFKFYSQAARGRDERCLRADPGLRRQPVRLLQPDRAPLRPGALLSGDQGGRPARLRRDRLGRLRAAGPSRHFQGSARLEQRLRQRAHGARLRARPPAQRAGEASSAPRAPPSHAASSATRRVAPGSGASSIRSSPTGRAACRRRSGPIRSRLSCRRSFYHRRRRKLRRQFRRSATSIA